MVVEGVHVVPGHGARSEIEGALVVQMLSSSVSDEEVHAANFFVRDSPPRASGPSRSTCRTSARSARSRSSWSSGLGSRAGR